MKSWELDLYVFHCATAPREILQRYMELYLTEKNER